MLIEIRRKLFESSYHCIYWNENILLAMTVPYEWMLPRQTVVAISQWQYAAKQSELKETQHTIQHTYFWWITTPCSTRILKVQRYNKATDENKDGCAVKVERRSHHCLSLLNPSDLSTMLLDNEHKMDCQCLANGTRLQVHVYYPLSDTSKDAVLS